MSALLAEPGANPGLDVWLQEQTGTSIGFWQWMTFGIPAAALLVPAAWWSVTRGLNRASGGGCTARRRRRGRGVGSDP